MHNERMRMRMHMHMSRQSYNHLDGGMVVNVLRMLIFGVVRVVLHWCINDAGEARPEQQGCHCHRSDCLERHTYRIEKLEGATVCWLARPHPHSVPGDIGSLSHKEKGRMTP